MLFWFVHCATGLIIQCTTHIRTQAHIYIHLYCIYHCQNGSYMYIKEVSQQEATTHPSCSLLLLIQWGFRQDLEQDILYITWQLIKNDGWMLAMWHCPSSLLASWRVWSGPLLTASMNPSQGKLHTWRFPGLLQDDSIHKPVPQSDPQDILRVFVHVEGHKML